MKRNTSRRILCLLTLAGGFVMASPPAWAADPNPAERATALPEVVVTARRVEENLQNVPVSVTVASGARLEQANVHDINDLQRIVPGVQIRSAASDTTGAVIAIRGQVQTETLLTTDPSVAVYVDGAYIPRTPGLRVLFDNPDELDRVEVLRGPQGTLFGRNTTGGALNIVTLAPGPDAGGYLKGTLAEYGYREIVGGANLPLGDKAALRLSALASSGGALGHDGTGQPLRDRWERYVHARFVGHPAEHTTVDVSATYQEFKSGGDSIKLYSICGDPGSGCPAPKVGGIPVPGGNSTFAVATEAGLIGPGLAGFLAFTSSPAIRDQALSLFRASEGGGPFNTFSLDGGQERARMFVASGTISQDLGKGFTGKSITAFQSNDRRLPLDTDSTPFRLLYGQVPQDSSFVSEELQLLRQGAALDFVAGGFASRETGHHRQVQFAFPAISASNPIISDGDVTNTSLAVFGQAEWRATDRLTFTGGARYSSDKREITVRHRNGLPAVTGVAIPVLGPPLPGSTLPQTAPGTSCQLPYALLDDKSVCRASFNKRFNGTSWLASADYRLADDTLLYAKVSRGFRAGGFNLRSGGSAEAFSPFQPEYATQYETGLKATFWDHRARLNSAVYYTDYQNLQVQVIHPIATGGTTSIIDNAAAARIWGGEAEAVLTPVAGLTLNANAAYLHREYVEYHDGNLDRTPTPQLFPKWQLQAGASYVVPISFGEVLLRADYDWQSSRPIFTDPKTSAAGACCTQVIDPTLNIYQRAYGILNARVALRLSAQDIEIALFARNLTDTRYVASTTDVSGLGFRVASYGDPRVIGASFEKRFH